MASIRTPYPHLSTYLPLPFLKSTTTTNNTTSCCTFRQTIYLITLLLAFTAGVAAGHLYWRRVRRWTRRAHAWAHQWTSARRDRVVGQWERVVGRVEGAVAGWNHSMGGDALKQKKDEPGVATGETSSSARI